MTQAINTFADYTAKALLTKSPGFMRPIAGQVIEAGKKPEMEVYAQGPATDFLHGATGCVTEVGEVIDQLKRHLFYGSPLDIVNLGEEVPDITWYLAIMANATGQNLDDLDAMSKQANRAALDKHHRCDGAKAPTALELLEYANGLALYVAKLNDAALFHYDIGPDSDVNLKSSPSLLTLFHNVVNGASYLGGMCGFPIERLWASNIAKLVKRYGKKFSSEDALFRTLADERASLEETLANVENEQGA